MNGGEALVEALVRGGVDHAFTVPGESFLTVLEALRRRSNEVRLVSVRHEGGGAFAAEVFGRLSGRPAAVLVSRGPGATNAAIGVHTAMQGSSPMLLVVGHVRRRSKGREAFQEIDHHRMFGAVAKAVIEPDGPGDVAAATARALALCIEGRPGPVVLVVPRDLTEAEAGDPPAVGDPAPLPAPVPAAAALERAAATIAGARAPIVIAGEMVSFEGAAAALARFAEAAGAPVFAAYRHPDVLGHDHPCFAGHLEINRPAWQRAALDECDVIVAAGSRLDGITNEDYTLPRDGQRLVHLYPDAGVLDRGGAVAPVPGAAGASLDAIAERLGPPSPDRLERAARLHAAWAAFAIPGDVPVHGAVDMARVAADTRGALGDGGVVVADGGSFARWVHRYLPFPRARGYAGPVSGAMGHGVPGGLGAALARPGERVVVFVGDGSFMMTGQELATIAELALPVTVVVCDNSAHGSILIAQRRQYGEDADWATRLPSPDFVGLAEAYGMPARRVERTAGYPGALAEALARPGPGLLHVVTDDRDIAPYDASRDAV